MFEDLEPAMRAEVSRLIQDNKMIDAVKQLGASGMDLRTSKELVELAQRKLDPDAARAREERLNTVVRELGASEE